MSAIEFPNGAPVGPVSKRNKSAPKLPTYPCPSASSKVIPRINGVTCIFNRNRDLLFILFLLVKEDERVCSQETGQQKELLAALNNRAETARVTRLRIKP